MSYSLLQQEISQWMDRGDLTAIIPTFIRLAEARFSRDIRVQAMMRRARALGQATQYLPLPIKYLEMRRLSLIDESGNLEDLRQVTPESFRVRANGGDPQTYCVHRELEFDAPIATTTWAEMVYYRAFDELDFSSDGTTNWLLEHAYDVYLYGSLVAAEPYVRNDERVPLWGEGYSAAVRGLLQSDRAGRVNTGGQKLEMRAGGMTP